MKIKYRIKHAASAIASSHRYDYAMRLVDPIASKEPIQVLGSHKDLTKLASILEVNTSLMKDNVKTINNIEETKYKANQLLALAGKVDNLKSRKKKIAYLKDMLVYMEDITIKVSYATITNSPSLKAIENKKSVSRIEGNHASLTYIENKLNLLNKLKKLIESL